MSGEFDCLSCGYSASAAELANPGAVAECPQCGRDMYRSQPSGGGMISGSRGGVRTSTALPSRYGGGGAVSRHSAYDDDDYDEDEDDNPVLLRHTPFVVILGFIFSFVPYFSIGGLIISIIGYRLVKDNPQGLRGAGLAIAGIAIGSLVTLLFAILVFVGPG